MSSDVIVTSYIELSDFDRRVWRIENHYQDTLHSTSPLSTCMRNTNRAVPKELRTSCSLIVFLRCCTRVDK